MRLKAHTKMFKRMRLISSKYVIKKHKRMLSNAICNVLFKSFYHLKK
jgi:hypothetical protein